MFLQGRIGINRECVFRPLSVRNCVASKTWDLQVCPDDLTSRVRALYLPALSEPCKHIPRSYEDCPWGSRLRECVWEHWVPCRGHLDKATLAQMVKNLPAMQETRVWSLGWEVPLEKGMAIHSSILARKIPWTGKPGGLQSMGSQRVGHDWVTNTHFLPNDFDT